MSLCLKLPLAAAIEIEPCQNEQGHWGGCTWEGEDAWQKIVDPCPNCGAYQSLEVKTTLADDAQDQNDFDAVYRCHTCGASGDARPAA